MRMARAWLGEEPRTASLLLALVERGKSATPKVPEERLADWEKLLAVLAKTEDDEERQKARVEGLVRACKLFEKQRRAAKPPPPPRVVEAGDGIEAIPGFGPAARAALAEHGIRTVTDLVWLPPVAWDDLRAPTSLAEAVAAACRLHEATAGGVKPARVVVSAIVKSSGVIPLRGRRAVRVVLADEHDEKCTVHAFWFFMAHGVLTLCKPGAKVLVIGRIAAEPKKPPRTAHPELFLDTPESRVVRARYPRLGPPEATLRKGVQHALGLGLAPDPIPPDIALREGLPAAAPLLHEIHTTLPSTDARVKFLERLAWAEAFSRAWERIGSEARQGKAGAPALAARPAVVKKLEKELGFALTQSQREAIAEIAKELAKDRPMRRLLLGDVGTGKTAVALAAAAQCVAAGRQVAILAPTSVLAEQYVDAVKPLERALGIRAAFVAAGLPAASRRAAEKAIASGDARVAIGTHALLGAGVKIPELALVIVDEQQRLGVAQRLSLVQKGERPHLLTLSATPIPRTLALALRGELATSTLRERPAGRPPVTTSLAGKKSEARVIAEVEACCARGERVFWIVPRIQPDPDDEEDVDPVASAVERQAELERALPGRRVVLLHGGLSASEKRDAMHAFRHGDAGVLVGTTVVEVGVDVPRATLMVVEDAQRFGLAQLHQLRGRVGRGDKPGRCVLLHAEPLEGVAKARLDVLTTLSAGEDVARADLELRGAGDLSGTRQHGEEDELLYLASGVTYPWLERIEPDARRLAKDDPALAGHPALRSLVARLARAIAVREEAG